MSKISEGFKKLLISKLQENESYCNSVPKCTLVLNNNISNLTDKEIALAIEDIARCLGKHIQDFKYISVNKLFGYLDTLCKTRGIRYDRNSLGNGMMSVTDHKFVKEGWLLHAFAVVDRCS